MNQLLFLEICHQAFDMMLNVKMFMHQQEKHIKKENLLSTHGQQEGQAAMTYRTKKFLMEKRRQIKQQITDAQKDNQLSGGDDALAQLQDPHLLEILDQDKSMESIRQRLSDKKLKLLLG